MIEPVLTVGIGGLLLGLAGSLHCACMCGGIASGALFLLDPRSTRARTVSLLLLQAGRITTYAAAGGAIAGFASFAIEPSTTAASFRVLQWMGAIILMWIGFSMAGLLPRPSLVFHATMRDYADKALAPLRRHSHLGPFALGMTWGLTPCPMVYAALFSAALTGSAALGTLWMAAFGLGTLPGVLGAALGISHLSRGRRSKTAEIASGALITAFGFSTLYFSAPLTALLCVTR